MATRSPFSTPIGKKTGQRLWALLAIPCSLPLRGPFPANFFCSCYKIPSISCPLSHQFPRYFRVRSSSSSPTHILTLFTENIAELTHLDQEFTVCDLDGLPWLIALPEIHQKESVNKYVHLCTTLPSQIQEQNSPKGLWLFLRTHIIWVKKI